MFRAVYIVLIFIICFVNQSVAQIPFDTLSKTKANFNPSVLRDTIPKDSISFAPQTPISGENKPDQAVKESIKFADVGLDDPIDYGAIDTQWVDRKNNLVHLYGGAYVNYQQFKLNAGYIVLDIEKNIAEARSIPDKRGNVIEKPIFDDGTTVVQYNGLRFNFETEKGIVLDAITQEGNLYVHGSRTKLLNDDDKVVYNENALVTTCNHEHPHWAFHARKAKFIKDKIAVVGPANLEIAGVPTPLFIPFGFFPLGEGKSTGFIFPQDYNYDPLRGFGLLDFGWYFPINDHVDLSLTADFYTRGSFGLNASSRYTKRYKYNGNINIAFDNTRVEDTETGEVNPRRSFSINLSHSQDGKAHPFRRLNGSVNFSTNNFNAFTRNDAGSVLQTSYGSNLNFNHDMPNTPFNLVVGLEHRQNVNTGDIDISFPNIEFAMRSIYPFERKVKQGEPKWYETFNVNYRSRIRNTLSSNDSLLFSTPLLDNLTPGAEHTVGSSLNLKFFKYINFDVNAGYTERWYLKTREEFFDRALEQRDDRLVDGFRAFRSFNTSAGLSTNLFWQQNLKIGNFQGFRHKVTPTFSMSYGPDTRDRFEVFFLDGDEQLDTVFYNPFQVTPFSSSLADESFSFNYNFNNNLEFKYFSKKDSTYKKFKLFDTFTLNGFNNVIADSLNWSIARLSSNSRFFGGITTISTRWELDPYIERDNIRVNEFVWSNSGANGQGRRRFLRRESGMVSVTNRFRMSQILDLFSRKQKDEEDAKEKEEKPEELTTIPIESETRGDLNNPNGQFPGGIPADRKPPSDERSREREQSEQRSKLRSMFENLSFVHDFIYVIEQNDGIDTSFVRNHSISMNGSIPLTENWSIGIGNIGYNIQNGNLTYPQFTFSRKLHCWNMNFSWAPNRDSYTFFIGVSSTDFNFLKYNYGQNSVGGIVGNGGFR